MRDEACRTVDAADRIADAYAPGYVAIDRLGSLGASARMPFSKSLGEGLFELRFTLGQTARRITCRFAKDGRIILLTTFRKRRRNERSEVARARAIAAECARRFP